MQINIFHVKISEYVEKNRHVKICCCQYFIEIEITHENEKENKIL